MPAPASSIIERLALEPLGDDRFVSVHETGDGHVFGGLLVAQALRAAASTLDVVMPARSLHASFLVAGSGGERLHHEVERTRDGASFSTRRVVVRQDRGITLVLTADFHREEPGVDYELPPTPGVPRPDDVPLGRYNNPTTESRDVPNGAVAGGPAHGRWSWYRIVEPLPDDPTLHQHVLAYLSDHGPTRSAREPHAHLADDARRQSVSLDHSVWFHRPIDVNGWLLSELVPVATTRGRGLAIGSIRTADGVLAATVAQEVLLRER